MTVLVRAPRMKRGERDLSLWRAGKIYGSGWREEDIMDQKRTVASIGGIGGSGGVVGKDVEVMTGFGDCWFGVPLDCDASFWLLPSAGLTTSSDSRLTGSPIVVSFANFDSVGLSAC